MKTDVVIIGGGPGGATTALRLQQRGIQPVIVEREAFPRYHIGESMTGECGAIVRDLGFGDQMLDDRHPVKHGVAVYSQRIDTEWWLPVMMRTDDAELHDQFTWQVRRSRFDSMLLDEATSRGADFIAGRASTPIMSDDGTTLRGVEVLTDDGGTVKIEADITLDCSGQASFLGNKGVTGPKYLGAYDKQIAIFGGVTGYQRDDGDDRSRQPGNTHIFYTKKYHWAWAIPIDDEVTSIGIVVPAAYFRGTGESREEFFLRELRELNVALAHRTTEAVLAEPVHVIPNYSFQVAKFAGPGYMCVGDSHRFIDPIFSFGLYVSMKEAGLAAEVVEQYLGGGVDREELLRSHMISCERAIDILEDVLDTFWENPLAFSIFVHKKYRGGMIDVFAGRIYEGMNHSGRDEALVSFRKLLKRERSYDDTTLMSMPIGSRFHPERAPLWNSELDDVETTERWMRDLEAVPSA